jgi:hypothetical protein
MKTNPFIVVAFVFMVIGGLAMVSKAANNGGGLNAQAASPCLYEVISMGDSLVIGWLYGRCDRELDLRNPEDHAEINHSIARAPCKMFGVWVWPNIASPVVDTFPPWCRTPSKTEGSHVPER